MLVFHDDLAVPLWRRAGADALFGFSTRLGGVSPPPYASLNLGRSTEDDPARVETNRARFLEALGLDPARLATAGQVHGARIAEVSGPGHTPGCDALWTRRSGLALAVTAADCVPVLLRAPGAVAAVHAGWRGVAARLPGLAAETLIAAAGAAPGAIEAALGPCIRACCYEVGADVAARFPERAVRSNGGALRLDLVVAVRDQLLALGISDAAIHDSAACTACEPDRYFSHRRDAGRTGRQWGVAALRSAHDAERRGRAGV